MRDGRAHRAGRGGMRGLIGFVGASVGGWIGWALAERFGFMAAFFVSLVGTAFGIYAANRFSRRWM